MKTMPKNESYVKNSLTSPYSNRTIEGINNYIKVLNRIAFGYKRSLPFQEQNSDFKKSDETKREFPGA